MVNDNKVLFFLFITRTQRFFSFSHDSQNQKQCFLKKKKKKKKSRRTLTATTGSKKSYGSFSHLAEINKGRKKRLSSPFNPGRSSLFSLFLDNDKEKEKKRGSVSLFVLLRVSVTPSLPWLKWVLLSHSWLKIRRRRKVALSLSLSLCFLVQAKK